MLLEPLILGLRGPAHRIENPTILEAAGFINSLSDDDVMELVKHISEDKKQVLLFELATSAKRSRKIPTQ